MKTILSLLAAGFILMAQQAVAETKTSGNTVPFYVGSEVYAFPGKLCPMGSHRYQGPEAAMIGKDAIYCVFDRQYVPVPEKTNKGKCPGGGEPYTAPDFKPEVKDIIWCPRQGAQLGLKR